MCASCAMGGGGMLGAVNFMWEFSRFKLATRFPTKKGSSAKLAPVAKLLRAYKALHHNISGCIHQVYHTNPAASAKFPAAKFTAASLTWHERPQHRPHDPYKQT